MPDRPGSPLGEAGKALAGGAAGEPVRHDAAEGSGGLPVLPCQFLDGGDDDVEHLRVAEHAAVVEQAVVVDDVVQGGMAGLRDEPDPGKPLKEQRDGLGGLRVGGIGA